MGPLEWQPLQGDICAALITANDRFRSQSKERNGSNLPVHATLTSGRYLIESVLCLLQRERSLDGLKADVEVHRSSVARSASTARGPTV